jgi:hypothetical protein
MKALFLSFLVRKDELKRLEKHPNLEQWILEQGPGFHLVPETVLPFYQIKMVAEDYAVPTMTYPHRKGQNHFVRRNVAKSLVEGGLAEYVPQFVVVSDDYDKGTKYSYLTDPDVIAEEGEVELAKEAQKRDEWIFVAYVGAERSSHRVIDMILTGQKDLDKDREEILDMFKKAVEDADKCLLIMD